MLSGCGGCGGGDRVIYNIQQVFFLKVDTGCRTRVMVMTIACYCMPFWLVTFERLGLHQ